MDIPEINQVVLLRPTQSPIVFVQQLGRGLRKSQDKEYVVILDFIGNYKNNFMIPIALSGDRSYNKDNIRRYVLELFQDRVQFTLMKSVRNKSLRRLIQPTLRISNSLRTVIKI